MYPAPLTVTYTMSDAAKENFFKPVLWTALVLVEDFVASASSSARIETVKPGYSPTGTGIKNFISSTIFNGEKLKVTVLASS